MYKTISNFLIITFFCIIALPGNAQRFSVLVDERKICTKADKQHGTGCPCRSFFGVTDICQSKNEIDVRLSYIDSNQLVRLYVLTFDSLKKGRATLFIDSAFMGSLARTKDSPHFIYQLQPKISLDSIYAMLMSNKLLTIQEAGSTPNSGLFENQILYKNGKTIRKVYLPAPEMWTVVAPNKKLNHYISFVRLFHDYFTIEN